MERLPDEVQQALQGLLHNPVWAQNPQLLWQQFLCRLPEQLPPPQLAAVHNLFIELCQSNPQGGAAQLPVQPVQCYLQLSHRCAARSCANNACQLCCNDPLRPCAPGKHLMDKYLGGLNTKEVMSAHCGAHLMVELRSCATDQVLTASELKTLPNFRIQMCAVAADAYADARNAIDWDALPDKTLLDTRDKGDRKPVLVWHTDRGGSKAQVLSSGHVLFPSDSHVASSAIELPTLSYKATAQALLKGKSPKLVLLARAVQDAPAGGGLQPLDSVRQLVSAKFEVVTDRAGRKADALMPDTDLRKVTGVGEGIIGKLKHAHEDLASQGVEVPEGCACVERVGQLQRVISSNPGTADAMLAKALQVNQRDWESIKKLLGNTLPIDARLRVFYSGPLQDPSVFAESRALGHSTCVDAGLLFACTRGALQLGRSKGQVLRCKDSGQEVLVAPDFTGPASELVAQLQAHAEAQWQQPNHPGWAIYYGHTQQPEENPSAVPGRPYLSACHAAAAPMPRRNHMPPSPGQSQSQQDAGLKEPLGSDFSFANASWLQGSLLHMSDSLAHASPDAIHPQPDVHQAMQSAHAAASPNAYAGAGPSNGMPIKREMPGQVNWRHTCLMQECAVHGEGHIGWLNFARAGPGSGAATFAQPVHQDSAAAAAAEETRRRAREQDTGSARLESGPVLDAGAEGIGRPRTAERGTPAKPGGAGQENRDASQPASSTLPDERDVQHQDLLRSRQGVLSAGLSLFPNFEIENMQGLSQNFDDLLDPVR